jgi:predicted nuclease with TOPRIM domain
MTDTLSALALVAQGCIPEHAHQIAHNTILQAGIERYKLKTKELRKSISDIKMKMRNSDEYIDALEVQNEDNIELIDHLRDKKRLLKNRYKNLLDETDKQYHNICFLEHTTPHNTEAHDRRAFIQSNFKAPF